MDTSLNSDSHALRDLEAKWQSFILPQCVCRICQTVPREPRAWIDARLRQFQINPGSGRNGVGIPTLSRFLAEQGGYPNIDRNMLRRHAEMCLGKGCRYYPEDVPDGSPER